MEKNTKKRKNVSVATDLLGRLESLDGERNYNNRGVYPCASELCRRMFSEMESESSLIVCQVLMKNLATQQQQQVRKNVVTSITPVVHQFLFQIV